MRIGVRQVVEALKTLGKRSAKEDERSSPMTAEECAALLVACERRLKEEPAKGPAWRSPDVNQKLPANSPLDIRYILLRNHWVQGVSVVATICFLAVCIWHFRRAPTSSSVASPLAVPTFLPDAAPPFAHDLPSTSVGVPPVKPLETGALTGIASAHAARLSNLAKFIEGRAVIRISGTQVVQFPGKVAGGDRTVPGAETNAGTTVIYEVKAGDALTNIARAYGVSIQELRLANDLKTDQILVGQKLKVPKSARFLPGTVLESPATSPSLPPAQLPGRLIEGTGAVSSGLEKPQLP